MSTNCGMKCLRQYLNVQQIRDDLSDSFKVEVMYQTKYFGQYVHFRDILKI